MSPLSTSALSPCRRKKGPEKKAARTLFYSDLTIDMLAINITYSPKYRNGMHA